jgi:hypothetical protein
MSRRIVPSKGKQVRFEVAATSCHVCKAHGKPCNIVESHNFRDIKGRVCCPTMLENICSKCGRKGHFQSKCEGLKEFKAYKSPEKKAEDHKAKMAIKEKPIPSIQNTFSALAEDSSEEEEAIRDDPPANVTVRKPVVKKAQKAWGDYESDDDW